MPDKDKSDNGLDIRILMYVGGAGAVGGFAGWLFAAAASTHLLPWPWYGSIPAAMFFGALAAAFGVYILANTDVTKLVHTLVFAALCGLSFKPIFDAGQLYVAGLVANHASSTSAPQVATAAAQLKNSIQSGTEQQVAANVDSATNATTSMLQNAGSVTDAQVKTDVTEKSTAAVDAVAAAAPTQPSAAIDGLTKIGTAAQASGQGAVSSHVLESFLKLESTTTNPAVLQQIQAARAKVIAAGKK